MPIPIPEALEEAAAISQHKVKQADRLPRYLFASALAGAYVGIAVLVILTSVGPLAAAGSPATKLLSGAVFGIALTLVVFAGADLFTGNVMFMLQGLMARAVSGADLAMVWVASLVGNLVGSVGFAAMVNAAGTLTAGAKPGKPGYAEAMVASMVQAKNALTGPQLFWRSVLCNMLVCLAMWMATRTKSDGAKLVVLWWGLMAFIVAGFEHCVANMTTFALGIFTGHAAWGDLWRNLAWTVPGNIVGGGLIVGIGYAWLGQPASKPRAAPPAAFRPPAATNRDLAVAASSTTTPQ